MIELIDGYFIDADEHNYIVCKKVKNITDKMKKTYTPISYHTTVTSAIEYVARRLTRERVHNTPLTIREAVAAFGEVEQHMKNIMDGRA